MSYSRVGGRAFNNANASGGLVFANANNASSNSNSNYGARLTFETYGGNAAGTIASTTMVTR